MKISFVKINVLQGSCGLASFAAKGYRYSLIREKNEWLVKRSY
jgi:hypothetical protein